MPYVKTNKTTRMFQIHKPSKKTFKKNKMWYFFAKQKWFLWVWGDESMFQGYKSSSQQKIV